MVCLILSRPWVGANGGGGGGGWVGGGGGGVEAGRGGFCLIPFHSGYRSRGLPVFKKTENRFYTRENYSINFIINCISITKLSRYLFHSLILYNKTSYFLV